MLTPDALAELRAALGWLEELVAVRLEERRAAAKGGRATDLLARPLEQGDTEGLPSREAFGTTGGLAQLIDGYGLTAAEAVVVLAALAPEADEKFDVLYGLLDDRGGTGLTGEVARTLVARTLQGRLDAAELLAPNARLRALKLVTLDPSDAALLAGRLRLNPELASWLLGRAGYEPEFSSEFPARRLTTVHGLDTLVLRADVRVRLEAVLERIRHREVVLDTWGFARHHDNAAGYVVLFHGPAGTGKTTAAAVLGRAAGVPVYRIDLSSVISKYIGETEKNLGGIFDRAEARDWILFFDEADALFGRRGEIHDARDRYANQEISYLLQRLETFSGVSILATNLVRNIDDAFLRLIHSQVAFASPELEERTELWRRLVPPEVPLGKDVDVESLADEYQLSGAEIRNAVFHAAFRASADGGVVCAEHLRDGVRAEYEKNGRLFPAAEA
jgi:ATPase family associated with various cellular activities (AAA)/Winged helix domain, variant